MFQNEYPSLLQHPLIDYPPRELGQLGQIVGWVDKNEIKRFLTGRDKFQYIAAGGFYGREPPLLRRLVHELNALEMDIHSPYRSGSPGSQFKRNPPCSAEQVQRTDVRKIHAMLQDVEKRFFGQIRRGPRGQ